MPAIVAAAWVGIILTRVVPYAFLQAGVLLPLFVVLVGVLGAPGGGGPLRAPPALIVLGRASYATYILHVPCFLLAARFDPVLWEQGTAIAIYALGLAALSLAAHRWVEEPARVGIVRRWAGVVGPELLGCKGDLHVTNV